MEVGKIQGERYTQEKIVKNNKKRSNSPLSLGLLRVYTKRCRRIQAGPWATRLALGCLPIVGISLPTSYKSIEGIT